MNLIKLLIISAITVPAAVSAVQVHAASDIQTVRNLEKMKTLADKVKSLISRYKTLFMNLFISPLIFTSLSLSLANTTPDPKDSKGRLVANLDKDYAIDIASSPVYPHYRKAKAQTDYLDREMSKLGTNEIPRFKPIKPSEQTV